MVVIVMGVNGCGRDAWDSRGGSTGYNGWGGCGGWAGWDVCMVEMGVMAAMERKGWDVRNVCNGHGWDGWAGTKGWNGCNGYGWDICYGWAGWDVFMVEKWMELLRWNAIIGAGLNGWAG